MAKEKTPETPEATETLKAPSKANTVLTVGGKAFEVKGGVVVGVGHGPNTGKK